jgi:hypothetical protein
MTTNLVLKSANAMSYAGGKAQFKVSWAQFLEDPRGEYLVSFSFISEHTNALDEGDIFTLELTNIGSTLKNIEGGNFNSGTSRDIGFIFVDELHSAGAEHKLQANYHTNPPVNIVGRPDSDILEVSFRDLTNTLTAKTPAFVLFLRFQKL